MINLDGFDGESYSELLALLRGENPQQSEDDCPGGDGGGDQVAETEQYLGFRNPQPHLGGGLGFDTE